MAGVFKMGMQQLRGPQLSMACDKFAGTLRWKPGDPDSSENFFDVLEICSNAFRERLVLSFGQLELGDRFEMSFFQAVKLCEVGIVSKRRECQQLKQAIGHAAHRGNNHGHAFVITAERQQNPRRRFIATRVGYAGAAQLVNAPSGSHCFRTNSITILHSGCQKTFSAYESLAEIQSGSEDLLKPSHNLLFRGSHPCGALTIGDWVGDCPLLFAK